MKGIKRLCGRVERKVPIPMSVIRRVARNRSLNTWDNLMTMTAIVTMFVFLLRSGEALATGPGQDMGKVLTTDMIAFRRKGEQVIGDEILTADEMILLVGKAKADQLGQGKAINVVAVPGDPLCPVGLMKRLYSWNDEHFNAEGTRYLFTLSSGKLLHRARVTHWLRDGARLAGYPLDSLAIISLRAGGASAMYAAGCTGEEIRERGRWESDCWRVYVWRGEDASGVVGNKLLNSRFEPLAALRLFTRAGSNHL
jgi:hypothetical protein